VNVLTINNRQRVRSVDLPQLRRIGRTLLEDLMNQVGFDIAIYLVGDGEITWLNETYLRHGGSTDVITFDYGYNSNRCISSSSSASSSSSPSDKRSENEDESEDEDDKTLHPPLHGEIFICLDEALLQARRFRTTWPSELVRYVVHGVLHLCGYNDQNARQRRQMKRVENQLLRQLAGRHDFRTLTVDKGTARVSPSGVAVAKLGCGRPRPRSRGRNRVRQKDYSRTRTNS
jgi:probable rRNA maturation factor